MICWNYFLKAVAADCVAQVKQSIHFFEQVEAVQDVMPYENIKITYYALEWGCGHVNLQGPLRKPGRNSDLSDSCWK